MTIFPVAGHNFR